MANTDGTQILPAFGSTYVIDAGQVVDVVLSAQVTNPYLTDSFRNSAVNNMPLGLSTLYVNLITTGTVGGSVPLANPGSPPTWRNYTDLTPYGTSSDSYVADLDGDGDDDVRMAGIYSLQTALSNVQNNTSIITTAYDALAYGVNGPMDLVLGEYQVVTGVVDLTAAVQSAMVFYDPPNTAGDSNMYKSAIQQVDVTAISTSGAIEIDAWVPEPTSSALYSLVPLMIFFYRGPRPKNHHLNAEPYAMNTVCHLLPESTFRRSFLVRKWRTI